MKFMKYTLLPLLLVLLSVFAMAQGSYTGTRFTATFNGPVSVDTYNNPTNSNTRYLSFSGSMTEGVVVRIVDHDIDVNNTSSQFYRATAPSEYVLHPEKNSDGYYQGHPYSFGSFSHTQNGVSYYMYERFIIVDSRTVVFIWLEIPVSEDTDRNADNVNLRWSNFEDSLIIR
jgi:hypothetical protein